MRIDYVSLSFSFSLSILQLQLKLQLKICPKLCFNLLYFQLLISSPFLYQHYTWLTDGIFHGIFSFYYPLCLSSLFVERSSLPSSLIKLCGIRATIEWENRAALFNVCLFDCQPFVYPTRYEGLIFARGTRRPLTQ